VHFLTLHTVTNKLHQSMHNTTNNRTHLMSGTECYILQQHGAIFRKLKQQKFLKSKTCSNSSSSSRSSSNSNSNSNSNSSVCNSSSNSYCSCDSRDLLRLKMIYEIRFVSPGQDITNILAVYRLNTVSVFSMGLLLYSGATV
jgi:hypothetical protein